MNIIITLFILISIHFVIIQIREQRKINRRKGVHEKIEQLLNKLIKDGKLKYRKDKKIPYLGIMGSENPNKTIILKAGMHGLETFSIQSLLIYIDSIVVQNLIDKNIQIIVIPIVNYWGYINYKRTNKNGVDLIRNSGYKSEHTRVLPLLKGWTSLWHLPLVLLLNKTWYYMGKKQQAEILELFNIINPILENRQDVILYDFHTGNNSVNTTLWRHELDVRIKSPRHLVNALKHHFINFTKIDYATNGGFYESLAEFFNKHDLNAYTVELAVLNENGNRYFWYEYFFGSVFEPRLECRAEKLISEVVKISGLIESEVNYVALVA